VLLVTRAGIKGYRAVPVGHRPVDSLNQPWLDNALCTGAGVRWYYLTELKKYGTPLHPVKASAVPSEVFPNKPIQKITVDQVMTYIDKLSKVQISCD